jgi:hypothetical protein
MVELLSIDKRRLANQFTAQQILGANFSISREVVRTAFYSAKPSVTKRYAIGKYALCALMIVPALISYAISKQPDFC